MNLKVQHRNVDLTPGLSRLIERKARKARSMLPTFNSSDLDLHVTLEKHSRGKKFQASLVLTTPQSSIRVEDIEDNPTSSLIASFDELVRKIKKFKSRLNRERFWQRQPVAASAGNATPGLDHFEEAINNNLDKIENYVRREVFHRAVAENLPPGLMQAQSVVDQVFLEVSTNINSKPENVSLEHWMFQVARDLLNKRLQELEDSRQQPHIEELSREEPQWEDEILNFYQPDEALKLEDLIVDVKSSNPEELLAREEVEEQIQDAIARLPQSVRESFVLYAMEGFNSDEIAMLTGISPEEVLAHLENARTQIKQLLNR